MGYLGGPNVNTSVLQSDKRGRRESERDVTVEEVRCHVRDVIRT